MRRDRNRRRAGDARERRGEREDTRQNTQAPRERSHAQHEPTNAARERTHSSHERTHPAHERNHAKRERTAATHKQQPARAERGERARGGRDESAHVRRDDGERVNRDERLRVETYERAAEGLMYGVLPVIEALRAGSRPVERVTIAEGAHESRLRELMELARERGVPVRRAPRAELQRLSAGANHQGVVAQVGAAHYRAAEELLDALSARVGTSEPPLALVLDGVEDPRNLGAIIRTAECAGAHGLFVPERRAAGLTETVAKASAGALEYLPVARVPNVARLQEELKSRGIWTVGTAAEAELDYTEWDWTQGSAVVLGGEGEGMRRLVRERCDVLVRVPLRGRIASLNVSVAAGIVLYEAVRHRTLATRLAYNESREQSEETGRETR